MTGEQPPVGNPFRARRLNHSRDFDPGLDVESLNASVSKSLRDEALRAIGREPDPGQMIPVLLAPPGYGKTHIFGRLAHALNGEAFFVFVGAISDPRRPLEHIRWTVVESLFRSENGNPSPLEHALADLFRDSVIEHVNQFPFANVARRSELLRELKAGNDVIMKIIGSGREISSFQRLGESTAASFPHVRGSVMKALVMGWSPCGGLARRWLRGEDLSDEEADQVGLRDESPGPFDVLNGVAAILNYQKPMVICCDQLDSTLKDPQGPRQLTIQLMEMLAGVPNQFVILSCLEDEWKTHFTDASAGAFKQRTRATKLQFPDCEQAAQLLEKRLKRWSPGVPGREALWPFDHESLRQFVDVEQPTSRALIQRCSQLFEQWVEQGMKGNIVFGTPPRPVKSEAELFLEEWHDELEQARSDSLRGPDHVQDARFYSALKELMTLAKLSGQSLGAVKILAYRDSALADGSGARRYGMRLELQGGTNEVSVVAAITTLNGGAALFHFVKELVKASATGAGAILFHPRATFHLGPVARQLVDKGKADGRLIIYALEEHRQAYVLLECALALLADARGGELVLGSRPISYEECQKFLLETRVLHGLDIFPALARWSEAKPPARGTSGAVEAAPPKSRRAAIAKADISRVAPGSKKWKSL